MGSSASKTASSAARTTAKSTPRKYPTRPPPPSTRTSPKPPQPLADDRVRPTVYPSPRRAAAAETRDRGVELDSSDPDIGLAARLSQLGPVQPNSTQSNSSTFNETHQPSSQSASQFRSSASTPSQSIFPTAQRNAKQNPAVSLLTARFRLAEEAEHEFANVGRRGSPGRQFMDVVTVRQILVLRDERGVSAAEIERQMGLREGVVARLGRRGVVTASEGGMMG